MATRKTGAGVRGSATKSAALRKATSKRVRPAAPKRVTTSRSPSVIMQARIGAGFARALVEQDAVVLGLDGPSALVREGLRLVHERAREAAVVVAYDESYSGSGQRAPLPAGVASAATG